MKQEVTVKGMSCQGCANSVKMQFEQIKGVDFVEMDLENNKAILDVEQEVPKDFFQKALEATSYEIV